MASFREVPQTIQSFYPVFGSTKEALEHARNLIPEVPHNTFMQAMLAYHNTMVNISNQRGAK